MDNIFSTEKKQPVIVNSKKTEWKEVTSGIPQGVSIWVNSILALY
jgi:hypothetical protein